MLPPELQLMVWDFWLPTKPKIRHFFIYCKECLCYAAFDVRRNIFVTETSCGYPLSTKIDLRVSRYPVIRLTRWGELDRAIQGNPPTPTRSGPFAWVDFERDVFFTFDKPLEWWRPQYFAFDRCVSDWWRHVHHLVLCLDGGLKPEFYEHLPRELSSLKTIDIIKLPSGVTGPGIWLDRLPQCSNPYCNKIPYSPPGRYTYRLDIDHRLQRIKKIAVDIEHAFNTEGRSININIIPIMRRYLETRMWQ